MEINNFAQASSKKTINLKFVAVAFSSVHAPGHFSQVSQQSHSMGKLLLLSPSVLVL